MMDEARYFPNLGSLVVLVAATAKNGVVNFVAVSAFDPVGEFCLGASRPFRRQDSLSHSVPLCTDR